MYCNNTTMKAHSHSLSPKCPVSLWPVQSGTTGPRRASKAQCTNLLFNSQSVCMHCQCLQLSVWSLSTLQKRERGNSKGRTHPWDDWHCPSCDQLWQIPRNDPSLILWRIHLASTDKHMFLTLHFTVSNKYSFHLSLNGGPSYFLHLLIDKLLQIWYLHFNLRFCLRYVHIQFKHCVPHLLPSCPPSLVSLHPRAKTETKACWGDAVNKVVGILITGFWCRFLSCCFGTQIMIRQAFLFGTHWLSFLVKGGVQNKE